MFFFFFFYRQPGTVYSQITRQNVKTGFARQTTATADLAAKKAAHPGRRCLRKKYYSFMHRMSRAKLLFKSTVALEHELFVSGWVGRAVSDSVPLV
jgi:hypothetical protein